MTSRLFILFALSAFPLLAQNCSSIQGVLVQQAVLERSPSGTVMSQEDTWVVTCTNTQTHAPYFTRDNSVTAKGGEGPAPSNLGMIHCNAGPFTTWYYLPAVGGTASNQFISYGHNNAYFGNGTCYENNYQTTETDCLSQKCSGGTRSGGAPPPNSPIVLDLSGAGFPLTGASGGVTFDIAGDGKPVRMGWTQAGQTNGFLALPAPDGLVHDGRQLFGNAVYPNGFAALAVFDKSENGGNGDGVIDARDAVYASLRVWIDANHDGISQPEELHTLPSLGIQSISLAYHAEEKTDAFGNVFHYRGSITGSNPDRKIYDVFFVGCP